ncbi:MAG TPA: Arc family DNA-binding protein [bacterium]|jgi:plasmid stability protein|nr:Arc family DNA-binding protein [bacterium]
MPDILIKDLPPLLHRRLKEEAKSHHRSMNQEIRQILEIHLERPGIPDIKPFVLGEPLTDDYIKKARREGRA